MMLSSLLPPSPSLSISFSQPIIFVHPPSSPDLPSNDPILRGSVTLALPKPRAFQSISVVFNGAVDVNWPDRPWAKYTLLEKKLEIELDSSSEKGSNIHNGLQEAESGTVREDPKTEASGFPWKEKGKEKEKPAPVLEKGIHVFEFSFIVPSTIPPYDRSSYGRTKYQVIASAKSPASVGSPLGFNSTLTASKLFHIIASCDPPGEVPSPFEGVSQIYHEDFGLLKLRHSSPHFTVGGILLLNFYLAGPPNTIISRLTESYILQQFTLIDPTVDEEEEEKKGSWKRKKEKRVTPFPHRKNLVRVGEDIPDLSGLMEQERGIVVRFEKGKEYMWRKWYRIPRDDTVRPTTLPGSETPMRISHKLVNEFHYQALNEDGSLGERKTATSTQNITITSCCCRADSIELPSYESIANEIGGVHTTEPSDPIAIPPPAATSIITRGSHASPRHEFPSLSRGTSIFRTNSNSGSSSPNLSGTTGLSMVRSRSSTPSTPQTPLSSSPHSSGFFQSDSLATGRCAPGWSICVCGQKLETLLNERARLWEDVRSDEEWQKAKWESETTRNENASLRGAVPDREDAS